MNQHRDGCVPSNIEERGPWLEVESGKRFYILDPRPEDVLIEDIAGALSKVCRFGGHVKRFYSVAEHCVMAREAAEAAGWHENFQLAMLLHDASEAYLVDIPRPVKSLMPVYKNLEANIAQVIYKKFGVKSLLEGAMKVIDDRMLVTEQRDLMPAGPPYYNVEPYPFRIEGWSPEIARQEFLDDFIWLLKRRRP